MEGAIRVHVNRTAVVMLGLLLSSCGGGSGVGDPTVGGAGVRTPIADLTGTWEVEERGVSNCPNLAEYAVPTFRIDITQRGNALTVVAPSGTFAGQIDGERAGWGGSYPSGSGTTTIDSMLLIVAASGDAFSGSATWHWSDGATSCGGTSQSINARRVSGTGAPPAAPQALSGTPVSASAVSLVWNDTTNETGYKLERRAPGASFAQIALLGADETRYTDTGLNALTAYEYRVRAYNAAGDSAYSNVSVVTTLGAPIAAPLPPSGLTLTVNSTSSISLQWQDNSANETSFHIERSTSANRGFTEIASVGANVSGYQDTGLLPLTRYYYRVRARNDGGDSAYSNTANATTLSAVIAPSAPSHLSANASGLGIRLQWRDNSNSETGFRIERSTNATGGFTQIATTAANDTSYSDRGLQPSTRYYYRVRATNALLDVDSGYSNIASARTDQSDDDDDDD